MQIIVFIFYFLFLSFAIVKIPFYKKSGISSPALIMLFAIKIFAGIAYAKFYTLPKYYAGSDTWRFYHLSLSETNWLLKNPAAFIKDLFVYGYSDTGNLFSGENTYWNDLKSNIIVKILALINVLTGNNYYTNIIFFNFLFLFGLVALFRLFNNLFPEKKLLILGAIFLIPSTLFWCSGIHKDGLILSATGIIIYSLYQLIEQIFSIKKFLIILLCLLLVFSLRNYVALALMPATLSWLLSIKYPKKTLFIFSITPATGIALFFIIPLIIPSLNFPLFITGKREEFLLLQGGSEVKMEQLFPSFISFVSFFPNAFDMAFLRPHIWGIRNLSYTPAAVEILLLFVLIIGASVSGRKQQIQKPLILFLFFFSISILLLAGYTIPFEGAIIRYRSLVLPLLITPLLCISNLPFFRKKAEGKP